MKRRTVLAGLIGSSVTATMAGCVVQNDPYAPPPQSTYTPAPSGPLQIGGIWGFQNRRGEIVAIDVQRAQGGIIVSRRGGKGVFYERIGRGLFRDESERTYQFFSATEAEFNNPNNGRQLSMFRP